MSPILRRYAVIIFLICTNIALMMYIRSIKKAAHKEEHFTQQIDSLQKTIKTNKQIYDKNINSPILTDEQFDSIQSAYEKKTGLSRLRDSLERSLSKGNIKQ
jgi:hypothetical protein